jgi:hypothetical protein
MSYGNEPYGVRWTNRSGQSTIYTHKTAREAKESVALANRDPGAMIHWTKVSYVGRKW